MKLTDVYMMRAVAQSRKVFRRAWGKDEQKPLWILLKDVRRACQCSIPDKTYRLHSEDKNADDWCVYGATREEQSMFMAEITVDELAGIISLQKKKTEENASECSEV